MTEPATIPERESDAPHPTWVPIDACTLPTVDQPVRAAEFDALFAKTLATVEQGCTANARSGADSVVMDVVVPDERAAVLAALVQRARDAREGADGGRTA